MASSRSHRLLALHLEPWQQATVHQYEGEQCNTSVPCVVQPSLDKSACKLRKLRELKFISPKTCIPCHS
jgi:hypothetical protein